MNLNIFENGFFILATLFSIGALCSLILKNDKFSNFISSTAAALGSLVGIIFSGNLLLNNQTFTYKLATHFPNLNISVNIDSLSAFFVLVISTVGLISSIYGYGYMKQFIGKYELNTFGFFYNIFLLSLILVATAWNSFYFLIVWEIMSVSSFFLVIFENKHVENLKAGIKYLVMTHLGTAFIILSFLLLYTATGSFEFDEIKNNIANIPEITKIFIILFAFIGFGTKAGIIPLHVWLPDAHPAAPSHISAIMSGVMIKTAILLMIRLFLDIIPNIPTWFGLMVLIVGSFTALLGVLYALYENDIKRLLAYSSVENIGIILLGLGSALTFHSLGHDNLATIGLVATLFHVFNHAIFKSLLFMGAGSVITAVGSRNMENYGGLLKRMPYTGIFFLLGALAISALPPLNGFLSEWMVFQSLFTGLSTLDFTSKSVFVIALGALAFTSGIAAACFVKAFGITFLARPRSKESERATESTKSILLAMGTLTALLLFVSAFGASFIAKIKEISQNILNSNQGLISVNQNAVIVNQDFSSLNPYSLFIVVLLSTATIYMVAKIITKNRKIKIANTWDCGAPGLNERMEITSSAFSRSLIMMFKGIMKPSKQTGIEYHDADIRYFAKSKEVTMSITNMYDKHIYDPAKKALRYSGRQTKRLQTGNINAYLFYIFLMLIILILLFNK